jgi:hypothetical protein
MYKPSNDRSIFTVLRKNAGTGAAWAITLVLGPGYVELRAQTEADKPFVTRSDRDFGDPSVALLELLRQQKIHSSKAQTFCVVGYQNSEQTEKRAWVLWSEGHKIILWSGATDPASAKTAIARSRRILDLRKDVVASEADIKGSTYLVSRGWVERLSSDCALRGEKYQITRK